MRISDWSSDVCSSDLLAAFKKHLFTGRREMPAHHVDEGRLAGAVGAEQAENFTFVHLQAHTVEGLHTLEGLGQVLHVRQPQIGRASCRARVCQYVTISVVAVY